MLGLLFQDPLSFIVIFGGIIIAIGIHEAAHCYAADALGDPTPRALGRVTLNPLAHLDPLGTLAILITGAFGWGKASPFDPYNLANPRRDTALIALAGPASNIALACVLSLLLHFTPTTNVFFSVLFSLIHLNLNLAIFNLLPVPPLDGSKIFLRTNPWVNQNNLLLLLIILFPLFGGQSLAGIIVSPITGFLAHLLTGI